MSSVVLDASAVLALVFGEAGSEIVANRLIGAAISTVNLDEVASKWIMKGAPLENVAERLASLDLEYVPMTAEQAYVAASLRPSCIGKRISQADRICLALGLVRGWPVLTGDRKWKELEFGVTFEFIR